MFKSKRYCLDNQPKSGARIYGALLALRRVMRTILCQKVVQQNETYAKWKSNINATKTNSRLIELLRLVKIHV